MNKLVVLAIVCGICIIENRSVIVRTRYGAIRGLSTAKSNIFYGVPYATPPKRWEDAVGPKPWKGRCILNATEIKPQCFQPTCVLPIDCISETSEDCLYVNIFTPRNMITSYKRAVMVWIHGGGFNGGTGSALVYNAENIVYTGDVIVVTINYRLGPFGFLVAGKGPDAVTGNYGIRDQRLALEWVQKNIHSFGGNPNKVTLFGQSAGAQSIAIHLFTEKSKNLFNQAIIQSLPTGIVIKSRRSAKKQGKLTTKLVGCQIDDIKCLKMKSPEDLIQALKDAGPGSNNFMDFFEPRGPHIDGYDITASYIDAAKNGLFQNKPVIIGTTLEENIANTYDIFKLEIPAEVLIFTYRFWRKCGVKASSLEDLLGQFECPEAVAIFKQYFPTNPLDVREESSEITSDFIYTCPTRNISTNLALSGNENVYVYIFNSSLPIPQLTPKQAQCATRPCHAADVPFVFNSFEKLIPIGFIPSTSDFALSNEVITYWTNFAKTGNPNGGSLVNWPKFTSNVNDQEYLVLQQSGHQVIQYHRRPQCDFWDQLGYE